MRQLDAPRENRRESVGLRWDVVLRALRRAAGVTQEGWAARLGYGHRTIQRWERGDVAPDAAATENLVRLCGDLGLYRPYRQGALAGLTVTGDLLREILADARTIKPGRSSPTVGLMSTRRGNLPVDLTSFVGRERDCAEVGRLLQSARLVTLLGPGGIGKTRLALRVAADLMDRQVHGAWLIELASLTDPILVPQMVAQAVGVPEQRGQTLANLLVESLIWRQALLVLDNCEQLVDACATLVGRLLSACPRLSILATSREPLGVPGEAAWRVPSLPYPPLAPDTASSHSASIELPPFPSSGTRQYGREQVAEYEAVRLFVERASAARPDFALTDRNAADIARICQRLDGVPLAIELAAAQARVLSSEEIAARLDDRFRLLVGGSRISPKRQQTLRAAVDWSYGLLDGEDQHLFDCLSVFAGSFSVAAAESVAVADIHGSTLLERLTGLVDKSLVQAEPADDAPETRFRLLETLRVYGRERLDRRGSADEVRRRFATWITGRSEQAATDFHGPEGGSWLHWLEREHANLRAILSWALERGDAETALHLGVLLWWGWGVNGRWSEGRAWLERSLALPGAEQSLLRPRALAGLGTLVNLRGDFNTARRWLDEAMVVGQEIGDEVAVLQARAALVLNLEYGGAFDEAETGFSGIVAQARRLGDTWTEGRILEARARFAARRGDNAAAAAWLEEGAGLARRVGDAYSLATALAALGDMARSRGDYVQAGELYAESLALREELGVRTATPSLQHNLGYVALAAGDQPTARERFIDALTQFQHQGDRRGVAECVIGLAGVAAAEGKAVDAVCLLGAGDAMLEAAGSQIWLSNHADVERTMARARAMLPDPAFEAAWAEGRGLTAENAIALAATR